ncbi:MAG: hypothetical protein HQ559_08070 [Lentisphaerae bacterium]|nr:hypothetical protein [Lentisphaerota bacterium]
MLKQLREMWKDGSMMNDVIEQLAGMVTDAQYVYDRAWEVCTGQAVAEKTEKPVRKHDKAVNRGERQIRRMLVQHLSINPGKDVSGCLAVMIMAKDVERVGDHGRNIFGIGARLQAPVTGFKLFDRMNEVQKQVGELFPKLERAILESNDETAREILSRYQETKILTKGLETALFETEMDGGEAVASSLLSRFFTRINAHIGNAASGVIFPLENIDFVSRGLREEEKDR